MLSEGGAPFPDGGRPENDVRKKWLEKKNIFGSIRVDDWFCDAKANAFVFRKPWVRDDLRIYVGTARPHHNPNSAAAPTPAYDSFVSGNIGGFL